MCAVRYQRRLCRPILGLLAGSGGERGYEAVELTERVSVMTARAVNLYEVIQVLLAHPFARLLAYSLHVFTLLWVVPLALAAMYLGGSYQKHFLGESPIPKSDAGRNNGGSRPVARCHDLQFVWRAVRPASAARRRCAEFLLIQI